MTPKNEVPEGIRTAHFGDCDAKPEPSSPSVEAQELAVRAESARAEIYALWKNSPGHPGKDFGQAHVQDLVREAIKRALAPTQPQRNSSHCSLCGRADNLHGPDGWSPVLAITAHHFTPFAPEPQLSAQEQVCPMCCKPVIMPAQPSAEELARRIAEKLQFIKGKCEQYWNEPNICDAEIHAALECIHSHASAIERSLSANPGRQEQWDREP